MKKLVVYYSYSGNTENVAYKISKRLNCDILCLTPVTAFTTDYHKLVEEYENNSIDGKEVKINDIQLDLTCYDKIIIGTPVWWYTICPVITTFLKEYDLSDKKIYPFATNAGWLGHTFEDFKKLCKNSIVEEGMNIVFNENDMITSEEKLNNYIDSINE